MELTGKCKHDFMLWYVKTQGVEKLSWVQFKNMPQGFKWGVLEDFFDSVDFNIGIRLRQYDKPFIAYINWDALDVLFETRNEARTEVIKKANSLYNENP